ncbi:MAG: SRPBCC family protein [Acidobacteria bacterium]|nr:SRPBCC family protein [Acidobacteriota bacterium]
MHKTEEISTLRPEKKQSLTDFLTNTEPNISQVERIVSGIAGGGLVAYGLKRRDTAGVLLAALGGLLGLRSATGHCQVYDALGIDQSDASVSEWLKGKIEVQKAVTINKSPAELYRFWRNLENLPQFMNHLEAVAETDSKHSHWKAKAPLGQTVEWDAEITEEVPNELIAWRSTENSDIKNAGRVRFKPTANRGTEVVVHLTYEAPAGRLGALAAKIFGEEPSQQVSEDLRRFKSLMETGLIMKVEGQTSGRIGEVVEEKAKARAQGGNR